jgi:hypothetical protein
VSDRRRLDFYVRHAEHHGAELVFEVGAGLVWPFKPDLTMRQLGALALQLRRTDPKWRLPNRDDGAFEVRGFDVGDLALMLVAEGVCERDAARMAGVSVRTLQRRQRPAREVLQQVGYGSDQAREPAFQSGENATNRDRQGDRASDPVLSSDRSLVAA